ncbi:transposable element Tcb1 transposase [Trichonephila clavipes]|uniref:Transposable element Tcb1 transposase n=1 Tax=Trichonephila clavipes TaxID=2585209 RepID=A0A8X6VUN0_TRICX|nr:transposable element Tcb1 transposase [Trichonephila clavipes]
MIAQRYVHDIMQPHVLPNIQQLPGAIFKQDNARRHTKGVTRLSPHCYNPSLACPISRFVSNRAYMGRQVGHATGLNELEAKLQQVWNEMFQNVIQDLYASMLDHIASCIRPRWSSTGY